MTRQQLKGLKLCTSSVYLNSLNYGHKAQTGGKNRSMEAKNSKAKKCAIADSFSAWTYACILEHKVSAKQNHNTTTSYLDYVNNYTARVARISTR